MTEIVHPRLREVTVQIPDNAYKFAARMALLNNVSTQKLCSEMLALALFSAYEEVVSGQKQEPEVADIPKEGEASGGNDSLDHEPELQ